MSAKNLLNNGKVFTTIMAVFTLAAVLSGGCGKFLESEADIERKFKSSIERNFSQQSSAPWEKKTKVVDVNITASDGDFYMLHVTFLCGGKTISVIANATYNGEDIYWKISGEEIDRLLEVYVAEKVRSEKQSRDNRPISNVTATHTGNNIYNYTVTLSDGSKYNGTVTYDIGEDKLIEHVEIVGL